MKCVLYRSADKTEALFTPNHNIPPEETKTTDGDDMVKEWECEAKTWFEAMNKYHKYMGWEPYVAPTNEEDIVLDNL